MLRDEIKALVCKHALETRLEAGLVGEEQENMRHGGDHSMLSCKLWFGAWSSLVDVWLRG